jgi:hypothetical protein
MGRLPITDVISIYQFQRTGDTESYPNTPTYQSVNACVSPMGTDIQADYGGVASFQLFEVFIYDVTLTLGNADKIVTASGQEYTIDGRPYVINNLYLQYIRCLCKQKV